DHRERSRRLPSGRSSRSGRTAGQRARLAVGSFPYCDSKFIGLIIKDRFMAPAKRPEAKRRYYTVEEANKTLPLVKAIASDIVAQFRVVTELKQRLTAVVSEPRRSSTDLYSEELAQSQSELEVEEEKLNAYIEELTKLGVELKGPDSGLCDF